MTVVDDTAPAGTARPLERFPAAPRAQVAGLSPAKRHALTTCFHAGALTKRKGAWHGGPDSKPVSGVTVADLARDGLLSLLIEPRTGTARLTERGILFARTLLDDAASAECNLAQA